MTHPENIKFEISPRQLRRTSTRKILSQYYVIHWKPNWVSKMLKASKFKKIHLVGKTKENNPRAILARLLRFKDYERLFSLGHRLRRTDYKMYQELIVEIEEGKIKQIDTSKKAGQNNIPVSFSKAKRDQLYIRGRLWPSGKPLNM